MDTRQKKLGGRGGYSIGSKEIISNTQIYIYVGGKGEDRGNGTGGFNGGGKGYQNGNAGGGGGASDVRMGGQALENRIIVAGGGGGAYTTRGDGHYGGGTSGGGPQTNTLGQGVSPSEWGGRRRWWLLWWRTYWDMDWRRWRNRIYYRII